MSSFKGKIRKYSKKISRIAEDLTDYASLNLSGNQIQRLTDFRSCKKPVLLIYGFAGTRRIFSVLEKRLRKDGFCVFSIHLGGLLNTFNTAGIIKSAKLIEQKIKKLHERYELGPLSIVGHSKGGLIGTYFVKFLDPHNRVRTLITMGTPHRGSPWALIGLFSPLGLISKSLRQMCPKSSFLRELNDKSLPENVHFVSIYSKSDSICPYPFCKVDEEKRNNTKNLEIEHVTHTQFVTTRRAYEVVRRELEFGLPKAERTSSIGSTPEKKIKSKKNKQGKNLESDSTEDQIKPLSQPLPKGA